MQKMGNAKWPSEQLLLWSRYILLMIAGIIALALIVRGDVTGKAGGSVLFWEVISSLKTFEDR
jgi:hypothetical protein